MKARYGVVAVLGLFVVGIVPLFVTFSSGQTAGLETRQTLGSVALEDESSASPLESSPARAALPTAEGLACRSTDMRILVLAADGKESTLPAIQEALDFLGIPYSVYSAADDPGGLDPAKLSDGCHGFYSGVILTNGGLSYRPEDGGDARSALNEAEWRVLRDYEADFDVRRVAWYAYPSAEYGFESPRQVNTAEEPVNTRLTDAGEEIFSYANAETPLPIRDAYAYLARPAGGGITPLLTDERGNAMAAVKEYPNGRETLVLTFDGAPRLLHSKILGYGLVNWVSRGLFLGERHIYVGAQVDDVLLPNELAIGETYRMTDGDLRAVLEWQEETRESPLLREVRLDMAYNAYGTTGIYAPDTLTPEVRRVQERFRWISHTFSHLDLDEVDYETMVEEIQDNDAWAEQAGLERYERSSAITPEHSGLENPEAMQGMQDSGVRYLVSNTTVPGYDNPSPNAGRYSPFAPKILLIPRYPNNLYFDVSTPEQWTSEYNEKYRDFWGRDLAYEEILDKESDLLVSYMIQGNMNPWMFHQGNLRAYDGRRTLIGDLLGETYEKYERLYGLPVVSPPMTELGERMAERMRYNEAGVQASVVPGESIRLRVEKAAVVPITGVSVGEESETYGGQDISYVNLEAGESITIPLR